MDRASVLNLAESTTRPGLMSASRPGTPYDEPHDSPSQVLPTASSGLSFGSSGRQVHALDGAPRALLAALHCDVGRAPARGVVGPDLRPWSEEADADRPHDVQHRGVPARGGLGDGPGGHCLPRLGDPIEPRPVPSGTGRRRECSRRLRAPSALLMAELQSEGGSRSVLCDANSRTLTRGHMVGAAARERAWTSSQVRATEARSGRLECGLESAPAIDLIARGHGGGVRVVKRSLADVPRSSRSLFAPTAIARGSRGRWARCHQRHYAAIR